MMRLRVAAVALVGVLMMPLATVEARGTGYLFVSSEKDDSVMVLRADSFEVVKVIDTSARPRHLQFDRDRTLIYAVCGEGEAIDIIEVAKLEVVDTILGIADPEALDISPDGRMLYISLEDDGALGILDLPAWRMAVGDDAAARLRARVTTGSGRVGDGDEEDEDDEEDKAGRGGDDDEKEAGAEEGERDGGARGVPGLRLVEVGEEPEGVMAHPAGGIVYVTSEVANMVHVIDVASGELKASIVVGKRPRRFAMTPDQAELWVTSELDGSVSIVDVQTNRVRDRIEFRPKGFRPEQVTPVGVTMTRDGKTAFVALGRANHVAVVDIASRTVESYLLVGERAWNTTLNRDESILYVVNGLSDDISVIDVKARKVVRSVPVGRVPYAVLIDD